MAGEQRTWGRGIRWREFPQGNIVREREREREKGTIKWNLRNERDLENGKATVFI